MSKATVEEVMARYPNGFIDRDTFAMYEGFLERKLLFNRCSECEQYFQPPWPSCPNCWSDDVAPTEVSGDGTVFTFVILHVGPMVGVEGVDYATGHPVAVVELDEPEGLRMTGPVIDCDPSEIVVGMRVEQTWIDREGAPVPAFRPAAS